MNQIEIKPLKANFNKACYELAKQLPDIMRNWPKTTRMGLGRRLEESVYMLLENLITIGNPVFENSEKRALVGKMSSTCDIILVYLRLAMDNKGLDLKKYAALSETVVGLGKQIGGFKKYLDSSPKKSKTTSLNDAELQTGTSDLI